MTTAQRLRDARQAAGLTQVELGRRMGRTTGQFVSEVERGHRKPTLDWLVEAASALGCDPGQLSERLASRREGQRNPA